MSYAINSLEDVYKYSQILFDYLAMHGHNQLAGSLVDKVDGCFSNQQDVIKAHKTAFLEIKEANPGLPPEHQTALLSSLEILAKV